MKYNPYSFNRYKALKRVKQLYNSDQIIGTRTFEIQPSVYIITIFSSDESKTVRSYLVDNDKFSNPYLIYVSPV